MSDEEKFTNRHGHTISAQQAAADTLPEPEHSLRSSEPKRRKRRKLHLSRFQKRAIVITIAVIFLLPVLVGEYVRSAYLGDIGSAKNTISKIFESVLSKQKTTVTSQVLQETDNQLAAVRDNACPGGFLDNLAKLYPRAQDAYTECAAYRSSVTALEDLVSVASEQMAYLERLQPLLGGVSQPLEDQFAVLGAQQENWQDFVDGLKQLTVPLTFSVAHAGLVKEAEAVRDQWIALVQASNVEDSVAFRAARAKLTESFTAFRTQTEQFSSAIAASQTSLSDAVSVLK